MNTHEYRNFNPVWAIICLTLSVLATVPQTQAGEYLPDQLVVVGGGLHTYDLMNVTLGLPATADQAIVDNWQEIVRQCSRRIWNYTEKQTALGRVEVYRFRKPLLGVDIHVENTFDANGNIVGARANVDSLESSFGRIYMPETPHNHAQAGVMAHEFGHYVFDLKDEYVGVLENFGEPGEYLNQVGNWAKVIYEGGPFGTDYSTKWGAQYGGIKYASTSPHSDQPFCVKAVNRNSFGQYTDIIGRIGSIMDGYKPIYAVNGDDDHSDTEWCTPNRMLEGWESDVNTWETRHHGAEFALVQIEAEQYTDTNNNGIWDKGEPYIDQNNNFAKDGVRTFSVNVRTLQDVERDGQSCWETAIARRPSLTPPKNSPVDNFPADESEWPDIDWVLAELRASVMVSLDRSGSMEPNFHQQGLYLMPLAIEGANRAIGNATERETKWFGLSIKSDGDKVGVSSYASSARTDAPLVEMIEEATKDSHKAAIASITASGGTAIGAALRHCLDELINENGQTPPAGNKEHIFLLSDGQNNEGENPEGDVLSDIQDRGVTIHTIALGPAVDGGLMARLAAATGGKTRGITDVSELGDFFVEIYDDARQAASMGLMTGSIEGSIIEHEIVVDPFGNMDLTANLSWESGDLDITLVMPDGTVLDHAATQANPDIDLIESSRSELYRVKEPVSGIWTVRIIPDASGILQNYSLGLSSIGQVNMGLAVNTAKRSYIYPEPVLVDAAFVGPYAVKGAEVSGTVVRPDGSEIPFTLFDDGDELHGDLFKNDGIYANYFSKYTERGEYRFVMVGTNVSGMTVVPGDSPDFVYSEGSSIVKSESVPPFTRQQTITVFYDGIPEFINATPYTETDFATWELDRNTGAMVGNLVVRNKEDSIKTLIEPFWYAVTDTSNVMLAPYQTDGITDDGDPYVDVTDKVNAALMAKYGRESMEPGEWVEIEGVAIYSRDRSLPEMTAVWSLWADPPASAERRIDNFDVNADGVLGDGEILLALQHWHANDMPDIELLRRIELWKNPSNR